MRKRIVAVALAIVMAVSAPAQAQQLLRDTEIEAWLDDYARPIFRAAGLPPSQIEILLIGD